LILTESGVGGETRKGLQPLRMLLALDPSVFGLRLQLKVDFSRKGMFFKCSLRLREEVCLKSAIGKTKNQKTNPQNPNPTAEGGGAT
jgi:hypothetical protein